MNETLKVLETRRSCRNFVADKMVSDEDIQAIESADPAPRKDNYVYVIE